MDNEKVKACEQAIAEKMREIIEIYKEAYPEGDYMSMYIYAGTNKIAFWNDADKDKEFLIEHWGNLKKE